MVLLIGKESVWLGKFQFHEKPLWPKNVITQINKVVNDQNRNFYRTETQCRNYNYKLLWNINRAIVRHIFTI